MTIDALARPEIRELHAYHAAVLGEDTLRLNSNEAARSLGTLEIDGLNRYPEARPAQLNRAMAAYYGVAPGHVLATRGSSEGIDLLIRTFCRPDTDSILTTPPAFELYGIYASVQGAATLTAPLRADDGFALDADSLLDTCDERTKLVFLCSPNNPVGTVIPRDTIVRIVEARAGRSIVVVDEAYVEYSGLESTANLIERCDNLVVLRTLSKAHALAGARCGAVLAGTETIRLLDGVLAPYALSSPVIASALHALSGERLAASQALVARTIAERERMRTELADCPAVARVWPSHANFLFVRLHRLATVKAALDAAGIAIRTFSGDPLLAGCARITVAAKQDNDRLLDALRGLD